MSKSCRGSEQKPSLNVETFGHGKATHGLQIRKHDQSTPTKILATSQVPGLITTVVGICEIIKGAFFFNELLHGMESTYYKFGVCHIDRCSGVYYHECIVQHYLYGARAASAASSTWPLASL